MISELSSSSYAGTVNSGMMHLELCLAALSPSVMIFSLSSSYPQSAILLDFS